MERKIFGSVGEVVLTGPPLQVALNAGSVTNNGVVGITLASTITGSGTIHSTLFATYGMSNIALGMTLSQAGTLSLQRYIDAAGTTPQGAAITQALTGGASGVLLNNDGHPFQSAKVTVVNSGTVTGTITNFSGVMQSS